MRPLTAKSLVLSAVLMCAAADGHARQAFEIAAGPVSGDWYLRAERLAGVVSHPPGDSRCAAAGLCGPEGLIATARGSAGAMEGLLAIARGEIASAFAPADVAAAMRLNAGKGKQSQSRLRALGVIGTEPIYLIAAKNGPVRSLRSMRGRWIGIGAAGGRTRIAAGALLAAAGIDRTKLRLADVEGAAAAKLMRERRLDAFVWAGGFFDPATAALIRDGVAQPIALDARAVARLTATKLGYSAVTISGVQTVAAPVVWLADEKQDAALVQEIVRAAFHKKNLSELSAARNGPAAIRLQRPPSGFAIPLHPGAVRAFAEAPKPSN